MRWHLVRSSGGDPGDHRPDDAHHKSRGAEEDGDDLHAPGEFPGTGIGLATVGRIVSRFEGDRWAEGCVGQGAKVFFTLPDAPAGA